MPDFDPDEYLKTKQTPAFDPDAYLNSKKNPEAKASMGQSAVSGLADILTFGHSDEIAAGGQAIVDKFTDGGDYADLYKKNRDFMRGHKKKMEADNPGTYKTAQVAGGIGSALASGGLGAIGNTQRAVGLATMGGAAAGSGYSDAELGSNQHLLDTGIGAGLGAATFGVGKLAEKAVKGTGKVIADTPAFKGAKDWASDKFSKIAAERAAKAAIGQNKRAFKEIAAQPGGIEAYGRKLLDTKLADGKKLIKFGNNVDEIGDKSIQKLKELGPRYNQIYDQIDELAPGGAVSPLQISRDIMGKAEADFGQVANKGVKDRLYKEAEGFMDLPKDLTMRAAQAEKNAYRWNPKKGMPQPGELDPKLSNELKSLVGKQMNEGAERVSPELAGQLKSLNKEYGPIKQTANFATDRKIADLSNRFISPSDHAAGLTGLLSNLGGLKSAGLALANKQVRTRGNAATAVGADKIAQALKTMPEAFGKYGSMLQKANEKGSQSLGLAHHLLWKNDAEYRALFSIDGQGSDKSMSAKPLGAPGK